MSGPTKRAHCVQWAHLMGSFLQPWSLQPAVSAAVVVLTRGITDDPERRNARRQSVRPTVQGWLGPLATGPDTPLTTDHITLSAREAPGERAPSRRYAREPLSAKALCAPRRT